MIVVIMQNSLCERGAEQSGWNKDGGTPIEFLFLCARQKILERFYEIRCSLFAPRPDRVFLNRKLLWYCQHHRQFPHSPKTRNQDGVSSSYFIGKLQIATLLYVLFYEFPTSVFK